MGKRRGFVFANAAKKKKKRRKKANGLLASGRSVDDVMGNKLSQTLKMKLTKKRNENGLKMYKSRTQTPKDRRARSCRFSTQLA